MTVKTETEQVKQNVLNITEEDPGNSARKTEKTFNVNH